MLTLRQQYIKRGFDLLLAIICAVFLLIPLVVLILISSIDTNSFGIFKQLRVGEKGILFTLFKVKTMREFNDGSILVTLLGKFLRKTKLDEIPQLFNVLIGDMSFVGPRPDIEGYADKLNGEDKIILSVKPGITGPATLRFSDEEELLAQQNNPLQYNDEVIWPQKIVLNKNYVSNWSFSKDVYYIWLTVKQLFR